MTLNETFVTDCKVYWSVVAGIRDIRIHPWATCALLWNFCVFHKDWYIIHPYIHICINSLNAELNPIRHLLALVVAHHILHVSRVRVNHAQLMNMQALTLGHYMEGVWYQSLEHLCLKVVVNCSCKESWPLPHSKLLCAYVCVCCIFCQNSSVGIVARLLTGWVTEQSRFESTHQWEIFLFSIASRWALRHM